MQSYSHADRVTSKHLLDEDVIRRKFCTGEDPFEMLPEATSFRSLVTLTFPVKMLGVSHVPRYVVENPLRFRYLIPGGCMAREYQWNGSSSIT